MPRAVFPIPFDDAVDHPYIAHAPQQLREPSTTGSTTVES